MHAAVWLPKVRPMLAQQGSSPFDSPKHLFEIKWDGMRIVTYVEQTGHRLVSRHGNCLEAVFPELGFLADLPPGSVLDGELVVLRNGRPDVALVQQRRQLQSPRKIQAHSQITPATYIVFDQLYEEYGSLVSEPLSVRREILRATVQRVDHRRLVFSEGVVGPGRAFYEQVVHQQQLEGIVAKRLTSAYRAGKRSGAWIKIKPPQPASRRSTCCSAKLQV